MLKYFTIALLLFTAFIHCENTSEYVLIEDKTTLPILTPSFADRHTLKIRLNNGLEAYLISDSQVEKSSAALTVKTGSWEDPVDYPGIAHFLEHMLFLGTKKYPNESEYDRYITEHGGLSNAFTANDYTSYIFNIDNSAFPEALDRFSSFFKEPLFNPSGVARELQAIDQEYAKNIENDDIREYFVHKELSNPDHPIHAFSMGNRNSLLKVSQDTLKTWYREHYSANRMRLVVISNLPIEKLKEFVIADFKEVPNQQLTPFSHCLPMILDSLQGHMVYIEPVKNIRKLSLIWELPQRFAEMRETKPELIVSHVLGHEGKNTLLANLKKEKLAEGIRCGVERFGENYLEMFLEIDLTDAGVKNVNDVILKCFEAIANFKKRGALQYLFDELHTMTSIDYQYQSREDSFDHIMKHASWSSQEDLATYPELSQVIRRFDPHAIEDLLAYMTPENCVFDLIAPKSLTGIASDKIEQWIKVHYAVKEIPAETLKLWSQAASASDIDLPEPNPFIPEKLDLVSSSPSSNHPINTLSDYTTPHPAPLIDSDKGKIYFSQDLLFNVPQISWIFEIKTPSINNNNPESLVLGDLYIKQAMEALSAYTYPASEAGLNFDIKRSDEGIVISIDGYNDKADLLFLDLIQSLKNLRMREQKFKNYKDSLLREYQNASIDKPIIQANEIFKSIIHKEFVTEKNKALAIKKISFERFEEFADSIFSKTYIEGMMYGNMSEAQALHLSSLLLEAFASSPYPKSEQHKVEIIVLPEDNGPFYIDCKTKSQGNAAILAIESLPFTFKTRAAQQILMQAIREPFFSNLRTKQQTGYLVMSQADEVELHLFDIFAVQSNTHEPRDLLSRFELFIEGFLQELKSDVTEQRFNNIKQALSSTIKQPPKSITEMAFLLDRLAFTYHGDFDWIAERIKGFEDLAYAEFLQYAHDVIGKQNKRRLAILLSGIIPEGSTLKYKRATGVAQLRKLSSYEPMKRPENE